MNIVIVFLIFRRKRYFKCIVCRFVQKVTLGQIIKIAIRGDGKSPDQKVIDMQLQAANLVYIFDVIILSVTANKSGRLTVETSFLPLNSSKGGTLKCKP